MIEKSAPWVVTKVRDEYGITVTCDDGTGLRSALVDYYVEAVDTLGNVKKSPIQHVWIGDGAGSTPGGGTVVSITPDPAVAGASVSVSYNPAGRVLAGASVVRAHVGFNNWATVVSPDLALTWNAGAGRWEGTFTVATTATQLDLAFNNGAATWDNNSGADWHFAVTGGNPNPTGSCCLAGACTSTTQGACAGTWTSGAGCAPNPCAPPANFAMDGVLDAGTVQVAANNGLWIRAAVRGNTLYVAAPDAAHGCAGAHAARRRTLPGASWPGKRPARVRAGQGHGPGPSRPLISRRVPPATPPRSPRRR